MKCERKVSTQVTYLSKVQKHQIDFSFSCSLDIFCFIAAETGRVENYRIEKDD